MRPFKLAAAAALAIQLAACASGQRGPTRLADSASGGMWTMRAPGDTQACIAQVVGPTNAARYRVDTTDQRKTVYPTVVNAVAPAENQEEQRMIVERCL